MDESKPLLRKPPATLFTFQVKVSPLDVLGDTPDELRNFVSKLYTRKTALHCGIMAILTPSVVRKMWSAMSLKKLLEEMEKESKASGHTMTLANIDQTIRAMEEQFLIRKNSSGDYQPTEVLVDRIVALYLPKAKPGDVTDFELDAISLGETIKNIAKKRREAA